MFHNFFILFSSISPSTACCLFSLDTTCPNNYISFIDHMLLFICNAPTLRCKSQDFNTSHVTLYLLTSSHALFIMLFQYITCYSLSIDFFEHSDNLLEFQYISCYSLSTLLTSFAFCSPVSIHLMLLFIRYWTLGCYTRGTVSIHLMLLFIENGKWLHLPMESFQYISCYSLSPLPRMHTIRLESFNTSHVTLYLLLMDGALRNHFVSIHLMLLFITSSSSCLRESISFQYISCYSLSSTFSATCLNAECFNTSHVTLYRIVTSR